MTRRVLITAEQAFGIAADVGSYKEFLPLVARSTVRGLKKISSTKTQFSGDLQIRIEKLGREESFTSHVETDSESRLVTATSSDGPVKSLTAIWKIEPQGSAADVTISIDYVLKSMLLQLAAGKFMDYAAQKILNAFEARANELYGSTSS
ncbi:MAG: type II toxin-antitoxin system RatA family toxin [Aestuariivirga sp.]